MMMLWMLPMQVSDQDDVCQACLARHQQAGFLRCLNNQLDLPELNICCHADVWLCYCNCRNDTCGLSHGLTSAALDGEACMAEYVACLEPDETAHDLFARIVVDPAPYR